MAEKFEDVFTPIDELRKTEPDYGIQFVSKIEFEEEKQTDMAVFFSKTPLSILEEGSKGYYQQTVKWQSREIPTHNNGVEFEMKCFLAGITATSRSANKKQAKHKAALDYLHKVVEKGIHKEFHIPGESKEEAHNAIDALTEKVEEFKKATGGLIEFPIKPNDEENIYDGIPGDATENWVGKLQEILQKNKMSAPVYTYDEESTANQKKFIVTCTVSRQVTKGRFSTKKIAKTIAAYYMCIALEKGIDQMENDLLVDTEFDEHDEIDQLCRIEEELIKAQDGELALKELLSDTKRFTAFEMNYKLSSINTLGHRQIFLEVSITFVPPPEVDDLEVGAEHTQTEEIAKAIAVKEKERKKTNDTGPFLFCGTGPTEHHAKQNACQSALIHFNTYPP